MNRPLAIVTGASAGIGEAFARELHRRNYRVLLLARREALLEEVCSDLNTIVPGSAAYRVIDFLDDVSLKKFEDEIQGIDCECLVNNVGRGSFGPFEGLDRNEESDMVRLNVITPLRLAHAIIPSLKKKRCGGIIFVSSIAAFQPLPFLATYGATKAFNFSQSLALHQELKPFNIKVLSVCPGPTATEFGGVARVPGTLTGVARDSADMVAREAMSAYEKGRPFIVTGMRSKIISVASRLCPVSLSTWLVARELRKVQTKTFA